MSIKRILIVLVLYFSFHVNQFCLGQNQVLKGGIMHSEKLSPVPQFLQSGEIFDKNSLNSQKPQYDWHQVPKSLAGVWKFYRSKTLKTSLLDKSSIGKFQINESSFIMGTQMDKLGNIWECDFYPTFSYSNLNANTPNYAGHLSTYSKIIDFDDESVTFLVRMIDTEISKQTNKILSSSQKEFIYTTTLMSPNILRILSSDKFFNSDGSYKYEEVSETLCEKVSDFKPNNFGPNKFDFKKSFIEYLKHYDLQDLIPDQ